MYGRYAFKIGHIGQVSNEKAVKIGEMGQVRVEK